MIRYFICVLKYEAIISGATYITAHKSRSGICTRKHKVQTYVFHDREPTKIPVTVISAIAGLGQREHS